ncbi:LOW QUALITY PROTEIN: hypothetical protein CFOL_v3_28003, partial [Cephalotus follicularis]
KYCRYHCDHGHDTKECRHLKNQIEDLICKGHLRKYVDRDAPQGKRECREEAMQQTFSVQQHTQGKRFKIGGEEKVISFSATDLKGVRLPHKDPVVVTLQVKLFIMKRILLDSGSSEDILYKHAFDQLSIPEDQLKPMRTPLVGFGGEMVGSIDLSVVTGTTPCQTQVQMTFLVVDTPRLSNAIIGHPRLNIMEA